MKIPSEASDAIFHIDPVDCGGVVLFTVGSPAFERTGLVQRFTLIWGKEETQGQDHGLALQQAGSL